MRREFTGQAGSVPLILLLFVKQYQMVHVELVARSGQARAPAAGRNRVWLRRPPRAPAGGKGPEYTVEKDVRVAVCIS